MAFTAAGIRAFSKPRTCAAFCVDVLGSSPHKLAKIAYGGTGQADMPFAAFLDDTKHLYVFFLYEYHGEDPQLVEHTQIQVTNLLQKGVGGVSGLDMVCIQPSVVPVMRTCDGGTTIIHMNLAPDCNDSLQEMLDSFQGKDIGCPKTFLGQIVQEVLAETGA